MSRARFKDEVFLGVAVAIGQLGTCDRGKVGAVIVKDGRCVTWGYNGAPPGMPHCSENFHGWEGNTRSKTHKSYMNAARTLGCRNATHAEANALAFAARQGISTDGGTLYVECVPCINCARLVVASGITRVVAHREYRDPSGHDVLASAGVVVDVRD